VSPDAVRVVTSVGAFYLFFSFPRSGTWVTMVGRTASGDTGLGGDVSFFGFLTILPLFC
jgi:hypothetical protein